MVQENSLNKLIIICGPTASSKTALAIECAKLLNSEVISADSMYIYKGLDIGTAKPSSVEIQGIRHHLIDVVCPSDNFTVSDYKNLARPIIDDLLSKGRVPIICGGTGFYIDAILYDFSYGKCEPNLEVREYYMNLASENGNECVYNILKEKDVESASKLHPNDIKRVVRALEIIHSGIKKSELNDKKNPLYMYNAYSINYPRQALYDRINKRVDVMFEQGVVNEVKSLIDLGITLNNQCMQGIGYKEIYSYLNGEISLEDAIELVKLNTRHYAKRQITYFKRLEGLKYLEPQEVSLLAKRIVEDYDR